MKGKKNNKIIFINQNVISLLQSLPRSLCLNLCRIYKSLGSTATHFYSLCVSYSLDCDADSLDCECISFKSINNLWEEFRGQTSCRDYVCVCVCVCVCCESVSRNVSVLACNSSPSALVLSQSGMFFSHSW